MWHTSRGDRTLSGDEAELIGHGVDTLVDALVTHIDDDESDETTLAGDCHCGIPLFDDLTPAQRIALLHDVTAHLLTPTESPLPLSAHAEAAVAAIFVEIRDQVHVALRGIGRRQPFFIAGQVVHDHQKDTQICCFQRLGGL